jgi:hypothetical protein
MCFLGIVLFMSIDIGNYPYAITENIARGLEITKVDTGFVPAEVYYSHRHGCITLDILQS